MTGLQARATRQHLVPTQVILDDLMTGDELVDVPRAQLAGRNAPRLVSTAKAWTEMYFNKLFLLVWWCVGVQNTLIGGIDTMS